MPGNYGGAWRLKPFSPADLRGASYLTYHTCALPAELVAPNATELLRSVDTQPAALSHALAPSCAAPLPALLRTWAATRPGPEHGAPPQRRPALRLRCLRRPRLLGASTAASPRPGRQ